MAPVFLYYYSGVFCAVIKRYLFASLFLHLIPMGYILPLLLLLFWCKALFQLDLPPSVLFLLLQLPEIVGFVFSKGMLLGWQIFLGIALFYLCGLLPFNLLGYVLLYIQLISI